VIRVLIQVDLEEATVRDWIKNLKMKNDASLQKRQKDRDWQMRCEDLISTKGPALWETVVSRMGADADELRTTFPDDPSKDLQVTGTDKRVLVRRVDGTGSFSLEAIWLEEINGVGVKLYSEPAYSTPSDLKMEVKFEATTEGDVLMSFENSRVNAEMLSERLLKKVLRLSS